MPYAVVQRSLTPPTPQQLEAGFADVPGVAALDARQITRQRRFGVLMEGLDQSVAEALAGALTAAGVPAAAVDAPDLPELAAPMHVQRIKLGRDALVIYNIMGQPSRVAWDELMLIAIGDIPRREVKRKSEVVLHPQHSGMLYADVQVNTRAKEMLRHTLLLVTHGGARCHEINAERFSYQCLGERLTPYIDVNFMLVARELLKAAPRAALNQGAAQLAQQAPTPGDKSAALMVYPTWRLFEREVAWLLWWGAQPKQ